VHLSYLLLNCTSRLEDDEQLIREHEGFSEDDQQHIMDVFDELCPPPCLDVLEIERFFGRWFPRWMRSTAAVLLENLRILTMDDLPCCIELPNVMCQLLHNPVSVSIFGAIFSFYI
jgi:hypothetical protein